MRRLILLFALPLLVSGSLLAQTWSPGAETLHPRPPAVPDKMVFAGDTVDLTRQDLRERMDRELISFTYMHSTSLLMLKRSRRFSSRIVPILALVP